MSDSDLLAVIEGRYDILVTLDRNLTYQQKVEGRSLAVIVVRVSDQTPEAFRALVPALTKALGDVKPGEVHEISAPRHNGGNQRYSVRRHARVWS